MFTAALFTTAKTRKHPKCSGKWIKKMWYIYTRGCYLVIKKNEIMPFVVTRMDLDIVILRQQVRQRRRTIL